MKIVEQKMTDTVKYDIYGIINKATGKMYIGQTKQGYLVRFKQHLNKNSNCLLLAKAIQKYGVNGFTCELLDIAYDQETANEKEKTWIKLLKTYIHETGYNLSMGGEIGDFNDDTIRKMSESKKGSKNSFYGKHHRKETRQMMSELKKQIYQRSNHPKSKKVRCVETGVIYGCVIDASEATGANPKHIGSVANKKHGRKTAGGYSWKWI